MNKIGSVMVLVIALSIFVAGCTSSKVGAPASVPTNISSNACANPEPLKHVYNPARLVVNDPCKTVSGTVMRVLKQADGDYHIQLNVDPQYSDTVNQVNIEKQHGALVLEIVCATDVKQKDAVSACSGYQNSIPVPKPNQHITVTGQFVSDQQHGGWNEIHPVYQIVEG